jgi:hypothetical protein
MKPRMPTMFKQRIEEDVVLCTTLSREPEEIREPTARRAMETTNPADRLHR